MTNKVNTFYYDRRIEITVLEGCRINTPMYRADIKIFHGVTNKLDFTLRDSDRKPVKLLQNNLRAYIINPQNNELMLEREAMIVDEHKGLYTVKLYAGDIENWSEGYYNLSVIMSDPEGDEQFLFFDHAQQSVGTLELVNKPYPRHLPSTIIDSFTIESDVYYSSRLPANSLKNYQDNLHTCAIYTDNFSGKLWIQASLEETPIHDNDYFDLHLTNTADYIEFTGNSGILPINIEGNYNWIRFKYEADVSNTGSITQIMYRG